MGPSLADGFSAFYAVKLEAELSVMGIKFHQPASKIILFFFSSSKDLFFIVDHVLCLVFK